MSYNFSNLSHADFEDLARDLIGCELGVRFETFGPGPDGGIDGRHSCGHNSIILQAKHYGGSSFSSLKSAMRKERASIDSLSPDRYILVTSRDITPANKKELQDIIGPSLRSQDDIISASDLNSLLKKHPLIEKSHIKLWLSSAAVLEKIVHSATHTYTAITSDEIESKLRVYATNPSLSEAQSILESQHVLIVSGPPGVGKTTLAEMLSYAYVAEGWNFVAIRSLDDGLAALHDSKKQIFFFDDFLGKVALDKLALSKNDSDLARFMMRIKKSNTSRFVLTTRAYIFEEAKRRSESLADARLDISKYLLDVGIYTRRIKARILFNHLSVCDLPQAHINALIHSGELHNIIDHKNYNPRIIEWMTDAIRVADLDPNDYAGEFLLALEKPYAIWDTAFRTHIPVMCQNLLYSLFFCSEYGAQIEDLRRSFQSLHSHLCSIYGHPHDPKDFEESMRILEGGFISIHDTKVSFVNPSLRDYLTEYLNDVSLLQKFAATSRKMQWARNVWSHGKLLAPSEQDLSVLANAFVDIAGELAMQPVMKRLVDRPNYFVHYDDDNSERITLFLEWWIATHNNKYSDVIVKLANNPVNGFSAWRDGDELVSIICRLSDGSYEDFPNVDDLISSLEDGLVNLLSSNIDPDDLERLSNAIKNSDCCIHDRVGEALREAIFDQLRNIDDIVADIDSESTLDDYITSITNLSALIDIESSVLDMAVSTIKDRIVKIQDDEEDSMVPNITDTSSDASDSFDDEDVNNLFALLMHK